MVNNFGKFCRKLRIDKGELLYDMATKLEVSSAFLSKVEAQNYDSIDISNWNDNDRMMMLSFARKFNSFDRNRLKQFLKNEEGDDE